MSSSSVVKCLPSFCIRAPHFKPQENTHMNMHRGGSCQQSLTVLRWICPEYCEDKKTVVDWKQYFLQYTQKTKEGTECFRMWFSSPSGPAFWNVASLGRFLQCFLHPRKLWKPLQVTYCSLINSKQLLKLLSFWEWGTGCTYKFTVPYSKLWHCLKHWNESSCKYCCIYF